MELSCRQSIGKNSIMRRKRFGTVKRHLSTGKRCNRLSLSFERVHVRPILRTPVARAARNITRKALRIHFKSNSTVIDITPLPDKPRGRIRMPQEYEEDDDDKENYYNLSAVLMMRSASKLHSNSDTVQILPSPSTINFGFDIEPSYSRAGTEDNASIVMESSPSNISNLWSVEESEIYELATNKALNTTKMKSDLWTQAFAPKSKAEIFNNSVRIYSWLSEWINRLSSRKPEGVSVKRKRRSTMYDDDDDYECTDRELPNPLIIEGPCGSGKTSAVYCAAEELKIRVIEFSPSERRNGVSLEKKLLGAIENHYVQSTVTKRGQADIRHMFSPKTNSCVDVVSSSYKFSVVLIDDCDIIYANDDNFWACLKPMCNESKIPIILTCTNYKYIKGMLNVGSHFCTNESIHFVCPTTSRISRYLRAWLVGYAHKLLSPKWLWKLVEDHHNDLRSIINALHFQLMSEKPLGNSLFEPNRQLALKSHAKCIAALSELDASYGQSPNESVTWRAQIVADLDYRPDEKNAYQLLHHEYVTLEKCTKILDVLKRYTFINEFTPLFKYSWNIRNKPPLKPVQDAWMRSWPRFMYSWKNVGSDYMPCLWAIDEKFHEDVRRRLGPFVSSTFCNASFSSTSGTTSRTRSRNNRYCERLQHPFDEINAATVQAIDRNGTLRLSISKYAFTKVFQQH